MSSSYEDLLFVLIMGSVIYSYKDRYFIVVVFCGDGFLMVSDNNIFGFFLLVLLGWDVKKEGFFFDIDFIIMLKLRIGYGWLGNFGGIIFYIIFNIVKENGIVFINGVFIVIMGSICNMNLDFKWEICLIFNIGFDLGIWDNWLMFILELYYLKIMDMFYEYDVFVLIFVFDKLMVNIGLMFNQGVELGILVVFI